MIKNANILIAEDESIVAKDIESRLKRFGYDVTAIASSGEEAIQKAAQKRPDLALMDIRLKGDMDGIEAARQIRILFNIPVIYLTAYADEEILQQVKTTDHLGYLLKPLNERELNATIEIALDKHKKEGRKFREDGERLRLAVEASSDGFWDIDLLSKKAYVSLGWKKMLGYNQPEELRENIEVLKELIPVEDMGCVRDSFFKHCDHLTPYCSVDHRLRTKNGDYKWVRSRGKAIWDKEGKVIRVTGTTTDITEERALEEQSRKRQRTEIIEKFAGEVAHELNNRMVIVSGKSEILLRQLPFDHPIRPKVEEIFANIQRVTQYTKQLTRLACTLPLQPQILDINQYLEEMKKVMEQTVPRNIEITLNPSISPLKINVDTFSLDQIIMNLLSVAASRMPNGGPIVLETASVILDAEYVKSDENIIAGNYAMLSLKDTGPCFTPKEWAQIFKPASRDSFTISQQNGIQNEIKLLSNICIWVKQNGGYMDIQNQPDAGCIFRIYFPQLIEELSVKSSQSEEGKGDTKKLSRETGKTVLLVEDEDALREMTKEFLASCGYDIIVACNGEEAIQKYQQSSRPIDLLFTDIVMPGISGIALAQRLHELSPNTKILFTTGYVREENFENKLHNLKAEFLTKPYRLSKLNEKIGEMLNEKQKKRLSIWQWGQLFNPLKP